MYARILYVGWSMYGQADFDYRCVDVFKRAGHAVYSVLEPSSDEAVAEELAAAARTFTPTVVVWNTDTRAVGACCAARLADMPCAKVALSASGWLAEEVRVCFDTVVQRAFACDEVYRTAISSALTTTRGTVLTMQPFDNAKREAFRQACGQLEPLFLHADEPVNVFTEHPGACVAHYARAARYAVFFEGVGEQAFPEIALRVAEGALVLVQREVYEHVMAGGSFGALPEKAAQLAQTFVVFNEQHTSVAPSDAVQIDTSPAQAAFATEGQAAPLPHGLSLRDAIALFEANSALYEQAQQAQEQALCAMDALEVAAVGMLAQAQACAAAAGKPTVLAYANPATNVVLYGWFGARNFGDDLLMLITALRVRARYANAHVFVIGAHAYTVRHTYGFEAADPRDRAKVQHALEGARALVYCGGLLFDDPLADTAGAVEFCLDPWIDPTGQAVTSLLAYALGVPSIGLGIGAGPLAYEETCRAMRLQRAADMTYLVRDEQTARLLLAAGADSSHVAVKADLVLGARSLIEQARGEVPTSVLPTGVPQHFFMVALREWPLNPPNFVETVAGAIEAIVANEGLVPVFVPFDQQDVRIHEQVYNALSPSVRERACMLSDRPREEDILALIAASSLALAMRLHCSVLHHVMGKPAVGLSYNEKISAHFDEVGQSDFCLSLATNAHDVAHAAHAALSDVWDNKALEQRVAAKAALVDQAFDTLYALIDAAVPYEPRSPQVFYPRMVSKTEQERGFALQENARLQAEVARLQQRVAELEVASEQKKRRGWFR